MYSYNIYSNIYVNLYAWILVISWSSINKKVIFLNHYFKKQNKIKYKAFKEQWSIEVVLKLQEDSDFLLTKNARKYFSEISSITSNW